VGPQLFHDGAIRRPSFAQDDLKVAHRQAVHKHPVFQRAILEGGLRPEQLSGSVRPKATRPEFA
jgi:hypothetical protein